jgi:hypothetical protein
MAFVFKNVFFSVTNVPISIKLGHVGTENYHIKFFKTKTQGLSLHLEIWLLHYAFLVVAFISFPA